MCPRPIPPAPWYAGAGGGDPIASRSETASPQPLVRHLHLSLAATDLAENPLPTQSHAYPYTRHQLLAFPRSFALSGNLEPQGPHHAASAAAAAPTPHVPRSPSVTSRSPCRGAFWPAAEALHARSRASRAARGVRSRAFRARVGRGDVRPRPLAAADGRRRVPPPTPVPAFRADAASSRARDGHHRAARAHGRARSRQTPIRWAISRARDRPGRPILSV